MGQVLCYLCFLTPSMSISVQLLKKPWRSRRWSHIEGCYRCWKLVGLALLMQPEGNVCVALAWLLYCRIGFQGRLPTIFLITTWLLCSKPFSNLPGIEKRQSPEQGFTVPLGGPSLSFNFLYRVTTCLLQLQPCHTSLLHFRTLCLCSPSPPLYSFLSLMA